MVAWVNDDKTLRAYGSKTDAYATFKGMFEVAIHLTISTRS